MKIHLLAMGTKMPDWVNRAYQDYANRLPPETRLVLKEITAEKRTRKAALQSIKNTESLKLQRAIPENSFVIALDVNGKNWSTEQLATQLENWKMSGQDICLLIGGPEGLTPELLNLAQQKWSLSALTFPHPLVRVIVAEQLFRAWSITANHPYHRAG